MTSFPPPVMSGNGAENEANGAIQLMAGLVSLVGVVLLVACVLMLGGRIAGLDGLVTFQRALGFGVTYVVWRVIDLVAFRRRT